MNMKYVLINVLVIMTSITFSQTQFPGFLQGTWKMENKEIYEHWDKLNDSTLKGFSYDFKDGKMLVSEYIDISIIDKKITYTAIVLNQNKGKGIHFTLTQSDSVFIFENPNHDFPKKIIYKKISDSELLVMVSDGNKKGFSYKLQKQFEINSSKDSTISNPNYNQVLAKKLEADDYGMKNYILVILKTGTNSSTDKTFINSCFRGHMENINLLVKEGKLIVAGPIRKNEKTYRGIFILNVTDFEAAKKLLLNDTAIKEGLLDYELYNWYGSAALPEYLDESDKVWKSKP